MREKEIILSSATSYVSTRIKLLFAKWKFSIMRTNNLEVKELLIS